MTKKKDGRNKPNKRALKDIDENDVLKLAEKFWTKTEIAAFLNISTKTIDNRFSEIYTKGKENGKAKLRDLQFAQANKGNVTMLIWLGKQYLGQSDKQDDEKPIPQKIVIKLPESFGIRN